MKKVTLSEMETPQVFLSPFMQRRGEIAHPVPTKAYLQPSQAQNILVVKGLIKSTAVT